MGAIDALRGAFVVATGVLSLSLSLPLAGVAGTFRGRAAETEDILRYPEMVVDC